MGKTRIGDLVSDNLISTDIGNDRVGIGSTLPSSKLDVDGDANVSGVVTATSFSGDGSNLTGIVTSITAGSNISVDSSTGSVTITGLANTANIVSDTIDSGSLNVTGVSTFSDDVSIAENKKIIFGDEDLYIYHTGGTAFIDNNVGQIRFKSLSSMLFYSESGLTGGVVEDYAKFLPNAAVELYYDGVKKFETASNGVNILSTDTGSSAGPELTLYRNSSSPAPGDYLGQIMFKGENSNGGEENYAKITGKISDETLGTEDGLIETAIKGDGSFTIVSRQTSDELQLINGVGLSVDGETTITASSTSAFFIKDNSVDSTGLKLYSDSAGVSHINAGYGNLALQTSGVERARFDGSGNFGIGVTNPGGRLDVQGGSIYLGNSGQGDILFSNGNDTYLKGANNIILQSPNGTNVLNVKSTGNVGIGLLNPSQKLTVSGGNILVDSNSQLRFGTSDAAVIEASGSDGTSGTRYMRFIVNDEKVRIDNSGNVGVGVTNPTAKLDVNGDINVAGVVTTLKLHVDPVGSGFTYTEDLVVLGNARVTGILSIGTSSIVLDANAKTIQGINEIRIDSTESGEEPVIVKQRKGKISFRKTRKNHDNKVVEVEQEASVGIGTTVSVNTSGIITATSFFGTSANFSGNVSIGGTLTYEDVTNVDSVGLITARSGVDVTGNISVTGTVDGRDIASDGSKLDGIESGATADQTAAEILTLIKTVDGNGSGLDADTLDGEQLSDSATANTVVSRDGSADINCRLLRSNFANSSYINGALAFRTNNSSDNYVRFISDTSQIRTYLGVTATASDGNYLRSNATDTATGDITFRNNKLIFDNTTFSTFDWQNYQADGGDLTWTVGGTSGPEMELESDGSNYLNTELRVGGSKVWTAGNDGAGSGLDADLLDGQQGSYYLDYNNLTNVPTSSGNADTVDNLHASSFLRSDASDTASGVITFTNTSTNSTLNVTGNPGAASYNFFLAASNDTGNKATHFVNGSTRTADGGANAYTIRNDGGSFILGRSSQSTILYGSGDLTYNSNEVWHAGNDGSGSGLDADTLDGVNSGSFLRSDANAYKTGGILRFNDNLNLQMGTDNDIAFFYNGSDFYMDFNTAGDSWYIRDTNDNAVFGFSATGNLSLYTGDLNVGDGGDNSRILIKKADNDFSDHIQFYNGTTRIGEIGCQDTTWLRINQVTNKNIYTPRLMRADGGFAVGSSTVWHSGNDGSGSSLDADTVDGIQGASFLRSDAADTATGEILFASARTDFGSSGNWNAVGFSNVTNLHPRDHNQFWFGAGNGTWFTGTANTKSQASGLAADVSYAHDLLLSTMKSDVNHDRGITFAVDSTGAGNSGWRLGKWHSGDARDSSKFVVDGQIFAKAGNTDEYDYYADDYSAYYSSQGGNSHWVGDSGYGWHTPGVVSSSAIQIQSGNAGTNTRKPQIQFHQYGYGGIAFEYDGPNDTLNIIGPTSRLSNTGFKQQGNTIWHAGNDGSGSGLDADTLDGQNLDANANANTVVSRNGSADITCRLLRPNYGNDNYINGALAFRTNNSTDNYVRFCNDTALIRTYLGVTATASDGNYLRSNATDQFDGQTSGRTLRFRCPDGRNAASSSGSLFPLEVYQNSNVSNSDAAMSFHIAGRHARYFGLDRETNDLFTGGWSAGAAKYKIWHAANDGSGSGLDADLLDGLQLHTGRNNEANKVVRTDVNGYIQAGWINSTSGDRGSTIPSRIYGSNDAYIRYYDLASFRSFMNVTAKANYQGREQNTTDTNYWTGSMGWGAVDLNTVFHYGSGDWDAWGTPANRPSTATTHWNGSQVLHYTNGTNAYGYQIASGSSAGSGELYIRTRWGASFSGWSKIWNAANDGAGSGLDADTIDGTQLSNLMTLSGTQTITGDKDFDGTLTFDLLNGPGSQTRDKIRVWPSGAYAIGMKSGFSYGGIGNAGSEYAMSFQMDTTANRGFWWGTNGQTDAQGAMALTTNGKLTVAHSMRIGYGESDSVVPGATHRLDVSGSILATGDITAFSDINLKEDVEVIPNALDKVSQIRGVTFTRKDLEDKSRKSGVIAQEVEKVLPEVVTTTEDGTKTVAYGNMVGLLIEAVKEQQKQIDDLKAKLEEGN